MRHTPSTDGRPALRSENDSAQKRLTQRLSLRWPRLVAGSGQSLWVWENPASGGDCRARDVRHALRHFARLIRSGHDLFARFASAISETPFFHSSHRLCLCSVRSCSAGLLESCLCAIAIKREVIQRSGVMAAVRCRKRGNETLTEQLPTAGQTVSVPSFVSTD